MRQCYRWMVLFFLTANSGYAADIPDVVIDSYHNCLISGVEANPGKIQSMEKLGFNVVGLLVTSCEGFADNVLYHCRKAGGSEDECYSILTKSAENVLLDAGYLGGR